MRARRPTAASLSGWSAAETALQGRHAVGGTAELGPFYRSGATKAHVKCQRSSVRTSEVRLTQGAVARLVAGDPRQLGPQR